MYFSAEYKSPIGSLLLASDGESLVGLWLEKQKYFGGGIKDELTTDDNLPVFAAAKSWLDGYFAGEKPPISALPLAPIGSDFRQDVWQILCEIPYGTVITYGDIAKKIEQKNKIPGMSSQAVGGAVGHNPISIIIPCHRVVGSSGSLTGYAGGIDKKLWLLSHEGADITSLHVPTKGTAL